LAQAAPASDLQQEQQQQLGWLRRLHTAGISSMAAYATQFVLFTVVLAALAAQPAAAKGSSKTAAPRNSTFSTCNSGNMAMI
jgi:hypothetical protein